jgi:hypothetical protein
VSILLALAAVAPFFSVPARGQSVTLAWGRSTNQDVVGYNVHYGGAAQTYTNVVAVGDVTNVTISGLLPGTVYFFAATAVNSAGLESEFSNEVAANQASGAPLPGLAQGQFSYTTNNGAITLTGYTGPGGAVAIPSTINGLPLTGIGDDAFDDCTNLTSVTIPDSVTSIGDDAFYGCAALAGVTIPGSVTSIGDDAFYGCAALAGVAIPSTVANLGEDAFGSCSSLTAITVDALNSFYSSTPDGVLLNKNQTALIQCPGAKTGSYTIPNTVASIGDFAFSGCSGLTGVTIPGSVTNIGDGAFDDCSTLAAVYFQGNAPAGGSSAFQDDDATAYYLAGTTGWGPVFAGLPAFLWDPAAQAAYTAANGAVTITKYTGPGGAATLPGTIAGLPVIRIGSSAFSSCANLTGITLPDSLTGIGDWAFSSCTSLARVTIPAGVTNIGDWAFEYCTNLAAVTIGNGVAGIGEGAFDFCTGLTNATMGANVISIGNYAFEYCTNLAAVTLPNSLVSIGDWAFSSCASLAGAALPNNLASIGDDAFAYCSGLTNIAIPGSVTNLGEDAFVWCASLAAITVDALNPVYSSVAGVLFNKSRTLLIQYPPGLSGAYTLPDGVTSIGNWAFYSCASLTSVTLPNGVTGIGEGAFDSCASLAGVTIPGSVTSIGDWAFSSCTNLASITIPSSVTTIGDWAFSSCTNLASVYLQGNAPTCNSSAFRGDEATAYYLAGTTGWGPTFAGLPAFLWNPPAQAAYTAANGAVTITKYTGPGGAATLPGTIGGLPVAGIGAGAFDGCATLTSITIPGSVTNIGDGAFNDCANLTAVYLQGNAPACDSSAFQGDDATAYYLVGTTGWGSTFADLPAFLWDPVAQMAYTATNGAITITKYTGPGGSPAIPATITGLPVTCIGAGAFDGCITLTNITIPGSVTNIGNPVFAWCLNLAAITVDALNPVYSSAAGVLFDKSQRVLIEYPPGIPGAYTLPNSVTSIGDWAFSSCTNLAGVTMGNSVTNIGSYAFDYCISLTAVTIPGTVASLGEGAFDDCTNLAGVYLQGNAPTGGSSAFQDDNATAYYLAGTTGWGPTFAGLPALLWDPLAQAAYTAANGAVTITKYTGPGGALAIPAKIAGLPVTRIGISAFSDCTNLTSVTIPDSVTSIGDYAFYDCTNLAGVTIPDSVASIGNWAFCSCTNLAGVTLPGSVTSIGDYAFWECTSLAAITLPNSLANMGNDTFWGCISLTNVALPDGLASIGNYAFYDCTNLAGVTIPDSVTNIGDSAFFECTSLAAITLPNNLSRIGDEAFGYCAGLAAITLPNSLASLGGGAFEDCAGLTSVTIPNGVTNIGSAPFSYCISLAAITVDALNPVYSSVAGVLFDKTQTVLIEYPAAISGAYTVPGSVASIGDEAFEYCPNLTAITIGDNVTNIGNAAFCYCTALTSATIGANVAYLADGAFDACTALTNLYFQGNAPGVGWRGFESDSSATVYYLPGTTGWGTTLDGIPTISVALALPLIGTQTVNELTLLTVTNTTAESNTESSPGYALVDPPAGMAIDTNGVITWTPQQNQSPSTNLVMTVATSANPSNPASPPLSVTNTFTVIVIEVNVAPILPAIGTQTVNDLTLLTVTNTATESNIHSILNYALVNPPAGMAIDTNGVITWTPQQNQSPSANLVTTIVTSYDPYDLANPRLSATNSFLAQVAPPPELEIALVGGEPRLAWGAVIGWRYQVWFKDALADASWSGLGGALTALDDTLELTDSTTSGTGARFYRLEVLGPP